MRLRQRLRHEWYVASRGIASHFGRAPARRILFSEKQGWADNIRKGFRLTRHQISFGEMTREEVARHDLVVPLSIEDLILLDEHREWISDNPIPIPSRASVELCDDKLLFAEALVRNGHAELVPPVNGERRYPYILKKKIDAWGDNSHLITGEAEEERYAEILEDPDYYTQEIVTGPLEQATHLIFRKDEILCWLNVEYVFDRDFYIKGKDKPIDRRFVDCPHLERFAAILREIGFEGLCCFNYKEREGRPMLIEINPRFGGSLCPYFFTFVDRL